MSERKPTSVIDRVIAHFATSPIPGAESWTVEERGEADAFRETVLSIAAEKAAAGRAAGWIQAGVRFDSPRALAAFLEGSWAEEVERWLAADRLRWFYVMRKPPGLRLRLGAPSLDPAVRRDFESLLRREQAAGRITGFEYGLYEAEVHQFGGEAGMDLAHEFFTYDTTALLQLRRLRARDHVEENAEVLSLLVINDLFAGVCDDAWERWDAWRNLGRLAGRGFRDDIPARLRGRLDDDFAENREILALIAFRPAEALQSLAAPVRTIVERCLSNNARLIERLRQAVREQSLLFGPRSILPFFVIFHWNRWGFSDIEQCFLSDSMQRLFNPKALPEP
jgi:thiopeptide-type bacteriocin biosynthesis protein